MEEEYLRRQLAILKAENAQMLQYCHHLEECLRKTENILHEKMIELSRGSTTNSKSSVNPFYITRRPSYTMDDTSHSIDYQPSRLTTTKDSMARQNNNNLDSSLISAIFELSVDDRNFISTPVFSNQTQGERYRQEDASRELSGEILEKSLIINSKMSKKSIWSEPKISLVHHNPQEPELRIPIQPSSFALCQVESQKKCTLKRHYVVEILAETEDEQLGKIYKVKFFKTKKDYGKPYRFLLKDSDEEIFTYASDIVRQLPSPQVNRRNVYQFEVDFSKYHMVMY